MDNGSKASQLTKLSGKSAFIKEFLLFSYLKFGIIKVNPEAG